MRRILVLLLALFLLVTAAAGVVVYAVDEQKDAIKFHENILLGDKNEALGITVKTLTDAESYLHWMTSYEISEEPSLQTKFQFDDKGFAPLREKPAKPLGIYMEIDYEIDMATQSPFVRKIDQLLRDTKNGETKSVIVNVADLYQYYPLLFATSSPLSVNAEDHDVLREFFKIPVLDGEMYEIYVKREPDGRYSYGYLSESWTYQIETITTCTADAYYFTFDNKVRPKKYDLTVDTSQIPGGYGIYCLPYDENGAIVNELKTVFSLEESVTVHHISTSTDEKELYLTTTEEDGYYFTVIDIETMTIKHKFMLYPKEENTPFLYIDECYIYENFVVVRITNSQYAFITKDENSNYTQTFTFDYPYSSLTIADMCYHDGKLLIAKALMKNVYKESTGGGYMNGCGFSLMIYKDGEPIYRAEYENELDIPQGYGYEQPEMHEITVEWR